MKHKKEKRKLLWYERNKNFLKQKEKHLDKWRKYLFERFGEEEGLKYLNLMIGEDNEGDDFFELNSVFWN